MHILLCIQCIQEVQFIDYAIRNYEFHIIYLGIQQVLICQLILQSYRCFNVTAWPLQSPLFSSASVTASHRKIEIQTASFHYTVTSI